MKKSLFRAFIFVTEFVWMQAESLPVPEDLDTSDLVEVIASNGARVVRYRETSTGIQIVIEPSQKKERALEQK